MISKNKKSIILHSSDNVAVVLQTIASGERLDAVDIVAGVDIPSGHKIAIRNIHQGEEIRKYGQVIGHASRNIREGDHVHVDNVHLKHTTQEYRYGKAVQSSSTVSPPEQRTFAGYQRENGKVGTRNYLGVIATVSCSGDVAHFLADAVSSTLLSRYPHVDGAVAISHGGGCCHAPGSEGLEILQRTLSGYCRNPNFGGILLVGLGCEVNRIEDFLSETDLQENLILQTLSIQDSGGTRATIEAGLTAADSILPHIDRQRRKIVSAKHLIVGLECGGSDAYSGITANPALGNAVDLVVKNGGTAVLSETPEIYGAEHLLVERAITAEVGKQLVDRIRWWEEYTAKHGAQINNNPTPGNKAGGITTILEKSMGAVAKAGSSNINGVYRYAEQVHTSGLVFMDSPGYDVVSITGMIAGGANLVCFTTGRGSVCGFRPVPTIKIASSTPMFTRLKEDMDINCGDILEGTVNIEEKGAEIYDHMLKIASGEKTRSEALGFGNTEFVPWQMGAVL